MLFLGIIRPQWLNHFDGVICAFGHRVQELVEGKFWRTVTIVSPSAHNKQGDTLDGHAFIYSKDRQSFK